MKVIGVGFGRTGTLSLKLALEELGFGPCYHMVELLQEPERGEPWFAAAGQQPVDWESVFSGYQATVDWPGCYFWKELVDAFPDARVILTVRDPEEWYWSVRNTIYKMHTPPSVREPSEAVTKIARRLTPEYRAIGRFTRQMIWQDTFAGKFDDMAHTLEIFQQHTRDVIDYVSPDRLLVYHTGDGWEPLCDFLGVPVPARPYPRANDSGKFFSVTRRQMRARLARPLVAAGGSAAALSLLAAFLLRRRH